MCAHSKDGTAHRRKIVEGAPVLWARAAAASASDAAFFRMRRSTDALRSSAARSGNPLGSAEGPRSCETSPEASPERTSLDRTDDASACLPLALRNNHCMPLHLASCTTKTAADPTKHVASQSIATHDMGVCKRPSKWWVVSSTTLEGEKPASRI
jgi:hypothetical protein